MDVNTQPADEQLCECLHLTCVWPARHQQSSSLVLRSLLRSLSLLSTDSGEDDVEALPDDHPQWLYQVKDGEQDRSARTARRPTPFLRPTILGDTIDHALIAEHGAGDLLLSDSCSSTDLDSSDLSEFTEDVLKELKLVEAPMLAAAGRHNFQLAGEHQSRVDLLKNGLLKRQADEGVPPEEIPLLSSHAHRKLPLLSFGAVLLTCQPHHFGWS